MRVGLGVERTTWAALAESADWSVGGLQAFAARISGLSGWPRYAVAFLAGSVSVLAMPPLFLWPVLFVTFSILVWLIDGSQASPDAARSWHRSAFARAFASGWWFGFGYFVFGLFWVGEAFLVEAEKFAWLLPFAVTLLPAGLALFWGLAAGVAKLQWPPGLARVLILALTLSIAEWLRGHVLSGFPWNTLGYALTAPPVLMQSAALFGVYGLTLLTVVIFASPLVVATDRVPAGPACFQRIAVGAVIALVPLALLFAFGLWRLSGGPDPTVADVRLRIVQASVPQRDKWRADKQGAIFQDQLDLSRRDPSGRRDDLAGITHLIWPEASMPFLPLQHPEALAAIGDLLPNRVQLLAGALRLKNPELGFDPRPEGYNSLMVFGDDGRLETVYDKIHLVPFGEYLPLQHTLETIGLEQLAHWRGGFSVGVSPRPLLTIPGLPPAIALICYEAIFPGDVVEGSARPGLLINITNDGWFGETTGPLQHFHKARVRAVEEGLPLVRAANNGISAVVDPHGRVLAMLGLNARGTIDASLPSALTLTTYVRLRDWTFVALALFFASAAIVLIRRQVI
jgi:apolipoprotein N-acyltransferase